MIKTTLAVLCLFLLTPLGSVSAQTDGEWLEPIDVSGRVAGVREPAMAADPLGRIHLVWSQPSQDDPDGPGRGIHYARWSDDRWTQPVLLFADSAEKAEAPSIAADSSGLLHLVWSGGTAGAIMYSRALGDRTIGSGEWSTPSALPMPGLLASAPVVAVTRDNTVHVAYAVPLNNGRGVYYLQSLDHGETWSQPTPVVNAAAYEWPMVGKPTMAVGGANRLHIAWSLLPIPGTLQARGIFYSRSDDGGQTWSEPYQAAGSESEPDWAQLIAIGDREVHLLWGERGGRELRQHRLSIDGGSSFTPPEPITGLTGLSEEVGLTSDTSGRLHLVAVGTLGLTASDAAIVHRLWDGERWVPQGGQGTPLGWHATGTDAALAAVGDSRLVLAFGGIPQLPAETDVALSEASVPLSGMVATSRQIEPPLAAPTPLPTLTPTPTATPQPTGTPRPLPTPTKDLSAGGEAEVRLGPLAIPSDYAGLVLGAVPAIVLVLLFLVGIRIRQTRR